MPILGLNGSVIVLPFVAQNGLMGGDDILDHDLADYLTNDLSDLGVSTSEGSVGGYLYVTELEHIEFSAEQQEVFSEFNVSYVLTGYIRKIHSGLMLSIKIVELKSGKLVASSNKVLPNVVINSVL
jgi:TolB-like protein